MSDLGEGWIWTATAAGLLRMGNIAFRECADALGAELREHPSDGRKRTIHLDDVEELRKAQDGLRANRARRAGR